MNLEQTYQNRGKCRIHGRPLKAAHWDGKKWIVICTVTACDYQRRVSPEQLQRYRQLAKARKMPRTKKLPTDPTLCPHCRTRMESLEESVFLPFCLKCDA